MELLPQLLELLLLVAVAAAEPQDTVTIILDVKVPEVLAAVVKAETLILLLWRELTTRAAAVAVGNLALVLLAALV
jgi:hypothetical protein